MIEVQAFRKLLGTWLGGISGMSAFVGGRVYSGMPESPPVFPLVVYRMSRRPMGDYPWHGWEATVGVEIYDPRSDTLDDIEELIYQDLAQSQTGGVEGADLTDSDVQTFHLQLASVAEDEEVFSPEDDSFVARMRRLEFSTTFAGV